MPNVAFIRDEIKELLDQYTLIQDCIAGPQRIKAQGELYLPNPENDYDYKGNNRQATRNSKKYQNYKKRAVFYNATRRTLLGLLGQVFLVDPVVKLPSKLDALIKNATGTGLTLVQLSKRATSFAVAYSRTGLLVDYPVTEKAATLKDLTDGLIRPTITAVEPMAAINWRTKEIGAEEILSKIVLFETYEYEDDGFEVKKAAQFRVLELNAQGNYQVVIWKEENPTEYKGRGIPKLRNYKPGAAIIPKSGDGLPLKRIPFFPIGSENNDIVPDDPNFYDLADINVAHYRNSADYEQSCFVHGQATPVVTGLDEKWYKEVLKETLNFGSYGGIPLPTGATADLLQAEPNMMIKEAMEIKERQMIALGAKLIEQRNVQRTAFETGVDKITESSTLASTANNVSSAMVQALKVACAFINEPDFEVEFLLNTDFDISFLSTEDRKQAVEEWQKNAITFTEMRNELRKAGIATEEDTKAAQTIETEQVAAMAMAEKAMSTGAPNV